MGATQEESKVTPMAWSMDGRTELGSYCCLHLGNMEEVELDFSQSCPVEGQEAADLCGKGNSYCI